MWKGRPNGNWQGVAIQSAESAQMNSVNIAWTKKGKDVMLPPRERVVVIHEMSSNVCRAAGLDGGDVCSQRQGGGASHVYCINLPYGVSLGAATIVVVPDKINGAIGSKVKVSVPHALPSSEHVGVTTLSAVDRM